MLTSRVAVAVAATAVLSVAAGAASPGTVPAHAVPTTTLTEILDVPDAADTFRAELGPTRTTLAVSWSIPEASGSQGHREVWLRVRRDGAWTAPLLVSDPAVDSWEPQIAVDSGGTVEVAWREDLATDRLVVRAHSTGGLGERRVIAAAPSEGFRLANGPSQTVVVWDRYDASSNLEVHAAIDAGGGFGPSTAVSDTSSSSDFYAGDVSADAGVHVTMTRAGSSLAGTVYSTYWALRKGDGTWARTSVAQSLTWTTRIDAHVAVDQASGDALVLHHYDNNSSESRFAAGWDADPSVVAADPGDRFAEPADLGPGNGLAHRDALSVNGTLVGVLGDGLASVSVAQGTTSASITTPTSGACANGAFSLREDLSFVCLTRSDPAGAWVDVSLDAGNTVIGRITPGPGMTKLSVTPVDVTTPVFLIAEVNTPNPTAKSLLVLAPDGPPTPIPTDPTDPAPTAPAPVPPAPTTGTTPTTPPASTFDQLTKPSITGKLRVGKALKARPGTWTPEPVTVRHQWFAGTKKIRKATKARLLLKPSMEGKKISVRITLSRPGTTTVVVTVKRPGRVR